MNIRYSSLLLASILALSGCGSDSDSNASVNEPTTPEQPNPEQPLPEETENQVFGFAFDGTTDLSNLYGTDAVVQRLVVDTSGEYWLINNNTIDANGEQLDPLPSKSVIGLTHGKFGEEMADGYYPSLSTDFITDFTAFNSMRSVFNLGAKAVNDDTLKLMYQYSSGNSTTINSNASLIKNDIPMKESIEQQIGQYTGTLIGASDGRFGLGLGTLTINANGTFSIIDTRQCMIQGTLDNSTDSKFTVVNVTIDASSERCPLENGEAEGIRLIDKEGGTIVFTTPNDNNGYIFNYA